MKVVTPLEEIKTKEGKSFFLGGSTDTDWREKLMENFKDSEVTFINPINENWDSSWKEDISNEKFRNQVEWELDMQKECDINIIHFTKSSKSPISLLEFGLFKDKPMLVLCEEGFWKKGNIDVVCSKYPKIQKFTDMDKLVKFVRILGKI